MGAIDSIVDVIGTLLALHHLSVRTVSCSRIPMGDGTVWTDHGQLPVPAFATMRLLIGMKTCKGPGEKTGTITGELVTPTAAALLRVLTGAADVENRRRRRKRHNNGDDVDLDVDDDNDDVDESGIRVGRAPNFTPRAIGLGAGTKDFVKHPNVIRLILGDDVMDDDDNGRVKNGTPPVEVPLQEEKKTKSKNAGRGGLVEEKASCYSDHKVDRVTASSSSEMSSSSLESSSPSLSLISKGGDDSHDDQQVPWKVDKLTLLQANIDDITAELLAHVLDLLLKNGAIDAWVEPIVMKKGRSAHTLNCLFHTQVEGDMRSDSTRNGQDGKLMEIIFRHTTTLGIRIQRDIERAALKRKMIRVQTPYGIDGGTRSSDDLDGTVYVKVGMLRDEAVSMKAEFDDCKAISEKTGIPIKTIASYACAQAERELNLILMAED